MFVNLLKILITAESISPGGHRKIQVFLAAGGELVEATHPDPGFSTAS